MGEELRLDGSCHECGGMGPIVIVQSDDDPGDMGEPRIVHADDETIVVVPSFNLWGLTGRIETNLRVYDQRVAKGTGTDFDRGKAAAFRVVLGMLDSTPPKPTFVCGKPDRPR